MANFIVLLILGVIIFFAVRRIIRKSKTKASCCGDCSCCGGSCHSDEKQE